MELDNALALLKVALGITHNLRDTYFRSMLSAAADELKGRGIRLDLTNTEDIMLLVDYAEFNYRNRDDDKTMPLNLDLRIRNKKAKGRVSNAEEC